MRLRRAVLLARPPACTQTPGNAAAKGSIVQMFLTGEGQTYPPSVTGAITTASLPPPQVTPVPPLAIQARING